MENQKIEVGDLVRLSVSSVPQMTVTDVVQGDAYCIWFDKEMHPITHKINMDALILLRKKGDVK